MRNCTNFFRAIMKMRSKRSESKRKTAYQAKMSIFAYLTLYKGKRKGEVRRMRNCTNFFRAIIKMRSKRSEAKNCLSSKNVNLCLRDSVESIVQGIKIL